MRESGRQCVGEALIINWSKNLPRTIRRFSVHDFVLEYYFFALLKRRQSGGVSTLQPHREMPGLQVESYAQVPLFLFKYVLLWLCSQGLLAHARNRNASSFRKSNAAFFFSGPVYPLSIYSDVETALDVPIFSCFDKDEFDVDIVQILVYNPIARSPKYIHKSQIPNAKKWKVNTYGQLCY